MDTLKFDYILAYQGIGRNLQIPQDISGGKLIIYSEVKK